MSIRDTDIILLMDRY